MKSINVGQSLAVVLSIFVLSAAARADMVSDFYNSMVNKTITWQDANARFESMDATQQQAVRDYDHAHNTNFTSDFVSGITTTPHLDGDHSEPVTPHLDAPHSIVASTLTPSKTTVVDPVVPPIVDKSRHLDSTATDADRQAAKDKAMIEYVQSQVKNGVDGKNGTNGIKGTNGLTTTETKLDTATQARVSTNANNISLNTERAENNTRLIQDNSQSIDKLNNGFSALKDEVNNNQKEANAGISGAMAMSNIPQVMNNQTVAIGAGIGGYEGENALAVGASTRIGNTVVVKATVSDDTENNVGYGAGLSVGW
ncbi:YadA C-terminal domain-containing protein [Cedecea sp. NFIX57]|uniref:YadA C-terminal domain-containing protein n=1 Tax=Cedecea sp. NFIX57 TaxID=1566286 RepID=UPI000A0C5C2C|nr:YadA C-terminal domain-containing protein [Cedecea sp. NFIX57]SMG26929.1 YadA-like C-terminal region [Cedecea sp. NFIX57]